MNIAIYSRYSTENQSEKSIDDQVRVCKKYAQEHGMVVNENHIYADEAVSGSIFNRSGLQALEKAAENREFEIIVVDDLSRLSRSNYQMLTLVLKLNYLQVRIVSVSDGIDTKDENSKLGIQLRGLVNELFLDDLRKKTARGLEGQKLRGFSAGEKVYGYRTEPVGELRLCKRGRPRHDGMIHRINHEEAVVVRRIFKDFIESNSIHRIAAKLNEDKIPTSKNMKSGWNTSTVARILKKDKYIGIWDWRKTKSTRDPMTGRKKSIPRPADEKIPLFRDDLIIIDTETWVKTKKRWQELQGTWPARKNKQVVYKQKSYIHTTPKHLLSGLMKCGLCGGPIVLITGRRNGYYGCHNARRKICTNTIIIPRKRAEQTVINHLKDKVLKVENLMTIYMNVEKITNAEIDALPKLIKEKESELETINQEAENYLSFIKTGNFSKTVADALKETEIKTGKLKLEIGSFQLRMVNSFKAPTEDWIKNRLKRLYLSLSEDTAESALLLKEIMGPITMDPMPRGKETKPWCLASSKIQTLSLLGNDQKRLIYSKLQNEGEYGWNIPVTFNIR